MGFSSCCVVSGAYYLVQNHGSQTDITQTSNVSWNIRKTRYIRRDYSQKWDILGTPFFLGIIKQLDDRKLSWAMVKQENNVYTLSLFLQFH